MTEQTPTPPGASATADPGAAAPPPPADGPWARYGLIRPRHGRYLAGVCGALGRATNTDPLLWRVLIGVLAIFGVGVAIYLAVWLLTPAEGDSASPVEALFGRGYSTTSSTLTIVLGVLTVVLIGGITDSVPVAVIAAVALLVAALVANRNPSPPPSQPYLYPTGTPSPAATGAEVPGVPLAPTTSTITEPLGYRPPFAPHGPYVPAPPPPAGPVLPPNPKPEPSRLGRLILSLVLIALGGLSLADLAGANVPGTAYVATALAVIGLGLILGTWFGRARGYIVTGIVLSLALPMIAGVSDWHDERTQGGTVTWVPRTFDELSDRYEHQVGEATLDLRQLDFAGKDVRVGAQITAGEFIILLPPNVDTSVYSDVNLAGATIFGKETGGAGARTEIDNGIDGPGGGKLRIDLEVNFGHAEVTR